MAELEGEWSDDRSGGGREEKGITTTEGLRVCRDKKYDKKGTGLARLRLTIGLYGGGNNSGEVKV